jgi:hypothetical protein
VKVGAIANSERSLSQRIFLQMGCHPKLGPDKSRSTEEHYTTAPCEIQDKKCDTCERVLSF